MSDMNVTSVGIYLKSVVFKMTYFFLFHYECDDRSNVRNS